MGKKSSKTTTGPSTFAQPYISSGANALQGAYTGNQGNIADITGLLEDNTSQVLGSTLNNPGLAAASSYNQDVLGGRYLSGNPNLQGMIDNTNDSVVNRVQAAIGARGGAGGSAQAQILARELAKNETGLRYQDYATERGYQDRAVQGATALSGANNANIAALMQYLTGRATIPMSSASTYANGIGSLVGNSTTTSQSQPLLPQLLNAGAQIGSAAIMASDRRLKTEVERVGTEPDGLGRYSYRYVWGGPEQEGVMADEVAVLRPWALGPIIGGYVTVDYSAL